MNLVERICCQELTKEKSKKATMVTPYWTEIQSRPKPKALLAYEIYSKAGYPTEHEVIPALNALVEEGKARRIWTRKRKETTLWYAPAED